ncbi:dienelactone hydrolase family protein [Nocardia sp. BMG111209]|uniref:dienelactone hydrolase family protein n=1 Tax=Nocardia sp. BMG111209 TaxID=1160137 RepID=UPI000565D521|nr:dienelactone hydrolase family protein [Nocardia sp. BMG111209]
MTTVHGISVDVRTPDGAADAYLAYPDDGAVHPGVLVIQDGFGLRPSLRSLADRIAAHGYTVLLPNAYYRHGQAPVIELPDFIDPAQRPEILRQVFPMIRELTPELLRSDVGAYLEWLAASPRVAAGKVGLTGYCMGARLVVWAAAMFPDRVAAVAGFHGGPLVTDAPDSPHLIVGNITAELYFAHAGEDHHMTVEHISRFDEALAAAGVRHRTEVYEGVQHGYTQSDTAAYDPGAAERHYRELFALFDRTLRGRQGASVHRAAEHQIRRDMPER